MRQDRIGFTAYWPQVLVSIGMVAFLVAKIDLSAALSGVLHARLGYLLIALFLYPLGQVASAIKWQHLARALGIEKNLKPMVGLYFIGMFVNAFIPTSIGGHVTRGLYLSPDTGKIRSSFLSVLVERGTRLIAMVVLAATVMLTPYGDPIPELIRIVFPAATLVGFLGLCFLPWIVARTNTRMRRVICEELIVFWQKPATGAIAFFYSFLFSLVLVAIHVCIARALNLQIPLPYHFITVCLATLAGHIPSYNGIGVRDAAYVVLLSRLGIDPALGLLFSLVWFLVLAVSSLIGCVVYMFSGLTPTRVTAADRKG